MKYVQNLRQQSVDMGLILGKNMGGWVGFFIFGPHTPVTFLDKYLPRVYEANGANRGLTEQ